MSRDISRHEFHVAFIRIISDAKNSPQASHKRWVMRPRTAVGPSSLAAWAVVNFLFDQTLPFSLLPLLLLIILFSLEGATRRMWSLTWWQGRSR